jgi:hypothetical protein
MPFDMFALSQIQRIAKALESIAQSLGSQQATAPQAEVREWFQASGGGFLLSELTSTLPPRPNTAEGPGRSTGAALLRDRLIELTGEEYDALTRRVYYASKEPPQRIGVYDYASLVSCLTSNFQQAFPGRQTDPQDMCQLMAANILQLRRDRNASAQQVATLQTRLEHIDDYEP